MYIYSMDDNMYQGPPRVKNYNNLEDLNPIVKNLFPSDEQTAGKKRRKTVNKRNRSFRRRNVTRKRRNKYKH